jgi:hypothetical protein
MFFVVFNSPPGKYWDSTLKIRLRPLPSTFFPLHLYMSADQVKANEVGEACGTHGRGKKSVQGFGGKARRKETTWNTKA